MKKNNWMKWSAVGFVTAVLVSAIGKRCFHSAKKANQRQKAMKRKEI